jgi:two-component system response regulator
MQTGVDILVVEDDQDDLDLALAALKQTNPAHSIVCARDGEEALDFIFCRGDHVARNPKQLPKLILLDLKMPKVDGLEVLRQVKANPATQNIPVVMLSSSSRKQDLEACYSAGANSYLVKSINFERFIKDVRQIGDYWLNLNRA